MGDYKDLFVFQKAYKLAMDNFEATKTFPPEEKHSLTDQIRKSSRSVCANLVEAYRRRKYRLHVILKLTDPKRRMQQRKFGLIFQKIANTFRLTFTMISHLGMMRLVK